LNLLGEGFHFGGLIFGPRLEHLLALKEDLQLLLSVCQLVLGAPQLLNRLVPIPARPVMQDFGGQASLFLATVGKLQGGNRGQGSLKGVACRASEKAGFLETSQGALKGTPLLLQLLGALAMSIGSSSLVGGGSGITGVRESRTTSGAPGQISWLAKVGGRTFACHLRAAGSKTELP
jgi:hypothetical protein